MISAIFWNIRGVRSKKAIHRLKILVNINKVAFVAIMEPSVNMNKIEGYNFFLGFQHCLANTNGKIWCFWNHLDVFKVLANEEQHLTIQYTDKSIDDIFITSVYAKCNLEERRELWDSLESISNTINGPWFIGGDFNDIMDPEEKQGGRIHTTQRCFDFISTMEACGMTDIGFTGPRFTWCNKRSPSKRIWKRLDRVLINDHWSQRFPTNTIKHLIRTRSDHRPLLMKCHSDQKDYIRYFRFLNF